MTWMLQVAVAAVAVCGLAGCANSELGRLQQMQSGALSVAPSEVPGYDYRVALLNGQDVGYDPDVLEVRQAQARALLAAQCKALTFGPEAVIRLGTTPLGRERLQYLMQVRCTR